MKSSFLIALLSAAMASPLNVSPQPAVGVLRGRHGEGNSARCPGGSDYNRSVIFLNQQCPVPLNSQCPIRNGELCACQCDCSKEQCDAALAPFPEYCQV
ncbi:hypothetical protein GGR53DRAFT_488458 [Hypoxylon sp. FL1150]|nr:hypothetical protein GGR53DRAFT_488458 [Hypoxylon sp. FL1150]